MAYATTNPPALISQRVGASNGAIWFYSDGDPLGTVLGADYFSNGSDLGMVDGDKVIFYDETNDIQYDLVVDGVTAGGAATVRPAASTIGAVASVTASTYAPAAQESGTTFLLSRAAGAAVTLPAAAVGLNYRFVVATALTAGAYAIDAASGDFFLGLLNLGAEDGAADAFAGDGTTDLSVDLNGGTTGGGIGSEIEVTAVSASQWLIRGSLLGTGTVATPFSTA